MNISLPLLASSHRNLKTTSSMIQLIFNRLIQIRTSHRCPGPARRQPRHQPPSGRNSSIGADGHSHATCPTIRSNSGVHQSGMISVSGLSCRWEARPAQAWPELLRGPSSLGKTSIVVGKSATGSTAQSPPRDTSSRRTLPSAPANPIRTAQFGCDQWRSRPDHSGPTFRNLTTTGSARNLFAIAAINPARSCPFTIARARTKSYVGSLPNQPALLP
jgi:hypothetical protein